MESRNTKNEPIKEDIDSKFGNCAVCLVVNWVNWWMMGRDTKARKGLDPGEGIRWKVRKGTSYEVFPFL